MNVYMRFLFGYVRSFWKNIIRDFHLHYLDSKNTNKVPTSNDIYL